MGKKRHHRSRSRSKSPSRRHEGRSYHRHRDSSSEDSRDGSRRSPDYSSRSRRRSPSPSHSRSRRSRSRDKDYRSRDRKRSRSRDRRSRSRERRRNRSRERRRSRSRSRSRSCERSSRHRRSNSRERRRSRSKEKQTSEATPGSQQTSQDHRDLSQEIPGYENMTPAEQIKAKVKLMVEKSKVSLPSSETFVPSPSQLASIDKEGFEQTSFSSTQASGKAQEGSSNGYGVSVRGVSRYDSRTVDASEYAPRVVELSSAITEQESPQASTGNEETVPDEEKKSKWLKKLQLLREKKQGN